MAFGTTNEKKISNPLTLFLFKKKRHNSRFPPDAMALPCKRPIIPRR